MSELVLTYGAGGTQGAPVVQELLRRGQQVRALVTNRTNHTDLKEAGSELVQGNFSKSHTGGRKGLSDVAVLRGGQFFAIRAECYSGGQ